MLKVAVTCRFPFIVTEQVEELPLHAPPHPAKVEFAPAVAVSITWAAGGKFHWQVVGQLIPCGVLVTLPLPLPPRVTDKVGAAWIMLKVAVTFASAFTAIVQVGLLPPQAPPHPAKVEPVAAAAVSVTCVPGLKLAWQVGPQLIPEGTLETVPVPDPPGTTVSTGAL